MLNPGQKEKMAAAKERKAKRAAKRKTTGPNRATRIKRIKKELSALWSNAVRDRDGRRCLMCGKAENKAEGLVLNAHHWRHRKGHSLALAFDVRNGATLCYGCHIGRLHRDGDGAFILRFLSLMVDKIGAADCADMDEIARHPRPVSLEELGDIRDSFFAPKPEHMNVVQGSNCTHPVKEPCFLCGEGFCPKCDPAHRENCRDAHKP